MTPPERLQDVTLAERLIALADEMMAVRKECSEADIWVPRSFPRFWSEKLREIAEVEAAAALSVRGDLLIAAYDAGFDASGEGWNGEYGANTDGRHYIEKRTQALAELYATPPSEG